MKLFCLFLLASNVALSADFATGQAARLVIGQRTFTQSNEGATNYVIGAAGGIGWAADRLFVVDSNRFAADPVNNRVLIFPTTTLPKPTDVLRFPLSAPLQDSPADTCLVCARARANVVLGQGDFNNNAVNLTQSGMRTPTGVTSDGTRLIVADTDNNRILVWNKIPTPATIGDNLYNIPADVVIGQKDFTHNTASVPPSATSLRGPEGVWIQGTKLFVADTQNNRVLIYNNIPTSNGAAADIVLGFANFTTSIPATQVVVNATASNMTSPVSVTSDGTRLFVTDLGANRILIWNSIPTTNNAAADLELGQPDMSSSAQNNSTKLCISTSVDSSNNALYPIRCGKTLSFPRFALSDGKRLFVADGGNDRVLVYSNLPKTNGAAPDIILGEPDEFTDNPSAAADSFQIPASLALDTSGNLYVADVYNRRVVVYTPTDQALPQSGVRNAASLDVFALGSITVSGTITDKDTVTVTISNTDNAGTVTSKDYVYTVAKANTLADVVNGLVKLINTAPGDPNVTARPDIAADGSLFAIIITAKIGGAVSTSIGLKTAVSTSATEALTASGTNLTLNLQDAASLAPGSLVTIFGSNLSDITASTDFSGEFLPFSLPANPGSGPNVQVYFDGIPAPLVSVTPLQISAQLPIEVQDRSSVSAYVRTVRSNGAVTIEGPIAIPIVLANPGIFADPGTDPRPGKVYHDSANATGTVSVDGSIKAGDVGTIVIGTETFVYTVQASDTLQTVQQAFVALINANDNSPVTATAGNVFTRILLTAKVPGKDPYSVTVTASVSTNAVLSITALTANLCCASSGGLVTDDNPAVPGEIVYILATGLGPSTNYIDNGRVVRDPSDNANAPATPVDSILAGGTTANIISSGFVTGLVGVFQIRFQLGTTLTTNPLTQLTIAQQNFVSNVVTFPVAVPPSQ